MSDALLRSVAHTLPRNPRTDPEIMAECDLILEAAADWLAGLLPLNDLLHLGTIEDHNGRPSPRYSRWVAMCTAERGDSRRLALIAALDVVVKAQAIVTRQGVFDRAELHQHDETIRRLGMDRDPWERNAA